MASISHRFIILFTPYLIWIEKFPSGNWEQYQLERDQYNTRYGYTLEDYE